MNFLKIYGDTEGPLGFPMKDADARALDALLQTLPEQEYHRVVVQKATTEQAKAPSSLRPFRRPRRLRSFVNRIVTTSTTV